MRQWGELDIDIVSLATSKTYLYHYELGDTFFEVVELSPVKKGKINVHANLLKTERYITINLHLDAEVELCCDRSLDLFYFPIHVDHELIYKFTEEVDDFSDDLLLIGKNESRINLGQHIYDLIILAVPMKKLHPRFKEDNTDDLTWVYSSEKKEQQQENDSDEKKEIDPRWLILKTIKNKNIK